jgi:hypothetical protein
VAWIYVAQILCLASRVWLSVRLIALPVEQRVGFSGRTAALCDATGNVALLLGVIGTLIGITVAVSVKTGQLDPAEFLEVFSSAFRMAVVTTIAGGLTYISCLILNSIDEHVAGGDS